MTDHANISQANISSAAVAAEARPRDKRYLFNPVVDFLCLGGSSLFLLPLLLVLPSARFNAPIATLMLLIANLVNNPHFAHSYQIFYRGFAGKAFRPTLGRVMQARYVFAGLVVPAALILFAAIGIGRGDARLLGYGGNIMALFVGWHYVKQGYGMLMVDAALKRRFFNDREKKVFLVNSYVVWIFAWLSVNGAISRSNLWGLEFYTLAIPGPVVTAAGVVALAGALASFWIFASRWRAGGGLPWNGVVAYLVSLYLWLLFVRIDPLWLLVVPALHSLQYLVVVWRYEANYERGRDGARRAARRAGPGAHLRKPRRRGDGALRRDRSSSRLSRLLGPAQVSRPDRALRPVGVRRHDVPVPVLDLHQRPPLLPGQRDVAA